MINYSLGFSSSVELDREQSLDGKVVINKWNYYRSNISLYRMEEEDMEIDCSLFLRMSKPGNENLYSDPKPRNQRQAWVETHESKSLESELDYDRIVISPEENNVEANYLKSTENFTICKKCLSNRNEFEKDIDAEKLALPGENLSSRKEICICVMGDESTDKLMNEMDCNGLLAFHSEEEHRTTIFTIFDLPDEIMLKIFSYFSRTELCRYVAPVCETWLAYARDSTLWEEITEKEFRNVATDLLVKVIISWCSLLKVLDLKGRTDIDENSLRAIFASCPLIENISLAFCDQINDQMMKLFSDNCPNLKFVNFEGCKISDSSLIYLFGKPIHGLNLSHCNMISDEGLIFIANNFDKLSSLNLDGVQWISQASIEILVNLHAQNLTEVVLDGADLTDDSIRLLSQCYNVRLLSQNLFVIYVANSLLAPWVKEKEDQPELALVSHLSYCFVLLCCSYFA